MVFKGHMSDLRRAACAVLLYSCWTGMVFGQAADTAAAKKSRHAEEASSEELPSLPPLPELLKAKTRALEDKQAELEQLLADANVRLAKEQAIDQTFDSSAYLSMALTNTAPPADYELKNTQVYLDGILIAQGGKRNDGLPRSQEIFFAPIKPGCHQVRVEAYYTRLKNDVISQVKVDRHERIVKEQSIIAQAGYRIDLSIEGFEAHNTFASVYRGPALRFHKSVRPNFISGSPIVSLDEVLKQGRSRVDFLLNDASYQLLHKKLGIDGLPILTKEQQKPGQDGSVLFDAPLGEGKHTLNVSLTLGEKQWVTGGPTYNFRLNFDRDFYVVSGQRTEINLIGMPEDGFRGTHEDSRFARVTSKITDAQERAFFPLLKCQELLAQEKAQKTLEPKTVLPIDGQDNVDPIIELPPVSEPLEEPKPVLEQEESNKGQESLPLNQDDGAALKPVDGSTVE